ncbi:SPOR domain-containing protein [Ectothiorhodospira lacustris]|uniref:SPOR domain-containing protein n=1 Tax=Ectothiorhodospira lacustris TaxID=2899127 RepID=UPI001EE85233|nr:SPOR domain-containing protein [Ectothiorhodospira lacustris]MCG5499638.1 SPOR domain-containing protein [Ectothiorhodospira lacustris]MCG5509606.1 SPOR domain-containing protein [Ectothiorhodospira lacustris]MCG5521599.1 SPOR domain-containing protein [Ectothiorhodospira lacustris]
MARSSRRQASRRRQAEERAPLPGWVWGAAGLAVGLFAAAVVYLQTQRDAPTTTTTVAAPQIQQQPLQQPLQQPRPAAPAPAQKPVEEAPRPRFDFYTLLPELEVVVPEPQVQPRTAPGGPPPPPTPVQQPGRYLLQAGSFRAQQEADRLRASLALMGVEARIQQVSVNGDTWHRVQVGPFTDLDNLNRMRERLHANQVQTIMVRVPDA